MSVILASDHAEEKITLRDAYVDALMKAAELNERVLAVDADLMLSLNMKRFTQKFPKQSIDCGVQEANMYGVAAGLSVMGFIPFAHTFACFASRRACDQIFISGAYAKLNIKVVGSDPGVTAMFNGGTHMTFEDLAIMRVIPGMTIVEPADSTMMKDLVGQLAGLYGMYYLRLIRRALPKLYEEGSTFAIGKAVQLCEGSDVTIIASGICVGEALKAVDLLKQKGINARLLNMFTIKPVDDEAIAAAAEETGAIVTVENHNVINGLGAAVAESVVASCPVPMEMVGIQDTFGEVGPYNYLVERFGLTAPHIVEKVEKVLQRKEKKRIQKTEEFASIS
jgi:transketolase